MGSSASGWNELPEELWQTILKAIDSRKDPSTICALRATNKRLHKLAQPMFRCDIKVKCSGAHYTHNMRIARSLRQRITKLATAPGPAFVVTGVEMVRVDMEQELDIEDSNASGLEDSGQMGAIDLITHLSDTALSAELAEDIEKELGRHSDSGFFAFLLAVCPNIDCLHLRTFDASTDTEVSYEKVIHSAVTRAQQACLEERLSTGPLQNIRSIILSHVQNAGLRNVLRLLVLPKLSYFCVRGVGDTENHWDRRVPPPLESPYRNVNAIELVFDDTMLSGKGLACTLQSCVQPKALTMRWRSGLWNEHFKNVSIGWAIRRYGQTLEYLHLDSTDLCDFRPSSNRTNPGSFGSLKTLTRLRTLAAPGYAFWVPPRPVRPDDEDEDDSDGEDTDGSQDHSNYSVSDLDGASAEEKGSEELAAEVASNGETIQNEQEEVTESYDNEESVLTNDKRHEETSESHDNGDEELVPANNESPDPTPGQESANNDNDDEAVGAADESPEEEIVMGLRRVNSGADEQTIREAYPCSPVLSPEIDDTNFDALDLNVLPPSLKRIYVLGCYPDHYVYKPDSRKFRYTPHIYENEVETLRFQIESTRADNPRPVIIRTLPFAHFYIWEFFGKSFLRHVDYNQITGWAEQRLSSYTNNSDGAVEVY